MKKLTKDEFYWLSTKEQVKYINELSNLYSYYDWVYINDNDDVIDVDSDEVIDDVYDYLLSIHCEYIGCDLYGKCFADEE